MSSLSKLNLLGQFAKRNIPKLSTLQTSSIHSNVPKQVRIVEVGARDGLQNESASNMLSTELKVSLINRLSQAGLKSIETGAFVHPKAVPQMANSAEVLSQIERYPNVSYSVLVPNTKGFSAAIEAKATEIAVFAAASEPFSLKNINCTIPDSIERFKPVIAAAKEANIPVRGYVSCVLGCPYQGAVSPEKVASVSKTLYDLGCYEISLGDTIGCGNPQSTLAMLAEVSKVVPKECLAVHFHNTYGTALANIHAALTQNISVIDSSVSGLGGCPYAPGATGNVATEDVVYMLNGMGIETGVDLDRLIDCSIWISQQLDRKPASNVTLATIGKSSKL